MYESEVKSERIAAAAAKRAHEGEFSSGMRPYGGEADGSTVRQDEASHLREADEGIESGRSLAEVTRRMSATASMTSAGKTRTPAHLRGVLLSPRFAGLATSQGHGGGHGRVARDRGPGHVRGGACDPRRVHLGGFLRKCVASAPFVR